MSLGIDFGTILAPLWYKMQCFGVIVFGNDFWCDLLIDFDRKGSLFLSRESVKTSTFLNLFRSWCFWKFLGSLWLPFGSLLVPCWSFWFALGCILGTFSWFWTTLWSILVRLAPFRFYFGRLFIIDTLFCRNSVDFRWYLGCRSIFLRKLLLPPWPGAEPCLWQPG